MDQGKKYYRAVCLSDTHLDSRGVIGEPPCEILPKSEKVAVVPMRYPVVADRSDELAKNAKVA